MAKFKAPKNLAALSSEELADEVKNALTAFEPYNAAEVADLSDEDVEDMDAISAFLAEAKTETTKRGQVETERNARIEAARAAVAEAAKVEEPAAEEPAPEEPAAEEPVVEEVVVEQPEPVAASAKPVSRSVTKRVAPKQQPVELPTDKSNAITITAAAGVRNFDNGHEFESLTAAGAAILDRLQSLPTEGKGIRTANQALVMRMPEQQLSQANYQGRDTELLLTASNEARLQAERESGVGNLIAAGGWGAPSERLMDFCPLATPDGLLQLPEVTVTRGGVVYTKGPDFETVLNSGTGFWDMTEAVAEAGTELKTSLRPAIPPFVEKRLDAVGVMVEAGLLLRATWPELIDRYAQMAIAAHQLKVSAKVLAGIRSYTGAAIDLAGAGYGTALDTLHIIEMVAEGERQRHYLGETQTLEVLLPKWARNVIRVDLANRAGVDFLTVTNQQIDAMFRARNLRVQWLNLYQQIDVTTHGIASKYPDSLDVIMYPAGTYVKGVADVITLDTVYDSVNLKKNDYVHLFVEQGVMVTNPCGTGRRFTFPLVATGQTGANNLTVAFGGRTAP